MARKDLDFIPECYIDTNLVESLLEINGYTSSGVNHQHSCNNVGKLMANQFKNNFAVGIIDDDKKKISYEREFDKIAESKNIKLLKHKTRSHYIIKISPAVESFIISCADEIDKDFLIQHGLSSNLNELKKETKSKDSKKDSKFKHLFLEMRNSRQMQILGNILIYLRKHVYKSDVTILKTFFI